MSSYQDLENNLYKGLTATAGPARQGVYDYYNNILKAGPNWAEAAGPEFDAISKQYATAAQNMTNMSPALGGGLTRSLTQLNSDKAFGIGQVIGQLRPMAANALGTMSNQDYSTALSALKDAQAEEMANADRRSKAWESLGGLATQMLGPSISSWLNKTINGAPSGAFPQAGDFPASTSGGAVYGPSADLAAPTYGPPANLATPGGMGVASTVAGLAPAVAGGIGVATAGAGTGAAVAADVAPAFGFTTGAGTAAAGAAGVTAPATGLTGALGLGGGAGIFGLGAATIPVFGAAALGAYELINHFVGEGRKAANKFVQAPSGQKNFNSQLASIASLGQSNPSAAGQQLLQAWNNFNNFAQGEIKAGGKRKLVATQALNTPNLMNTVATMAGQLGVTLPGFSWNPTKA